MLISEVGNITLPQRHGHILSIVNFVLFTESMTLNLA